MQSKIVDAIVRESVESLFGTQGVALTPAQSSGTFKVVAVVGFAGARVRGSLGLGATGISEDLVGADDIEDWISEMANQLLGRIGNRFAARGVEVELAVPMVLRGVELRVEHSSVLLTYPFRTNDGELCAWIDVRPFERLELAEHEAMPVSEGDVCLF